MAEENKCLTHLDTESASFATEAEIPTISDQSLPTSNTGQLEERLQDMKTANTSKNVGLDSPPKSSLPPPPTHQSEHSAPTNLKTSVVELETKKRPIQLELESGESSETEAEAPVISEKAPLIVSISSEEPTLFCTETMPKENTSSVIADQLALLLPPVQHGQDVHTDSATENAPSTSRNKSPQKEKQSDEGSDQTLVEQVQRLELEGKTESSEGESKNPSEGLYIKSKGKDDKTWELPFRVRKTGLVTVWNEPDEDFVPNLAIRRGNPGPSLPQHYEETFQETHLGLQCQKCQGTILGDSPGLLCQQCLLGLRKIASVPQEPEGACGGATSDSYHSLEGATAASYEEEFPTSYSDFKETYERRSSVEQYIWMRHRQREGLPPYDKPHQETTKQQPDAYGDYERSDSEEDYQNFQRNFLLSPTQQLLFEQMRQTESEIFAAMSRPGETFEDLRNPEQEMREVEHYDRQMAIYAARYGGTSLEETTFPWTPQEFLDQETLYEMWRPPPDPVEKEDVEAMSPEMRRRYELEKMALMRKPREHLEAMLGNKEESEESGSEDTEYSEVSTPSGSTD